jgi:hypothetical protein
VEADVELAHLVVDERDFIVRHEAVSGEDEERGGWKCSGVMTKDAR